MWFFLGFFFFFCPESEISIYVIKSMEKKIMSFKTGVVWKLLAYIIKIKTVILIFFVWEKKVKLLSMVLQVTNNVIFIQT